MPRVKNLSPKQINPMAIKMLSRLSPWNQFKASCWNAILDNYSLKQASI
jgi:hypothetical protein